jgi:P-type Ca2+ transporter type 2C
MAMGILAVLVLHLFAIYNPFMQGILNTTALNLLDWVIILAAGSSIIVVEEIRKILYRKNFFGKNHFA